MWHNMFPMDESAQSKRVIWMGSSLRDSKNFPAEVKDVMGYALYQAQIGGKAAAAKPLTGFGGATVLEIVEDFRSDTYRAVYTVKFSEAVYVLDAFQKKSKKGVTTPKSDLDLIKRRLVSAEADYEIRFASKGRKR
jgi:phage-related protein